MNKISNQFASIEQVTDQYLTRKSTDAVTSSGVSFEDILKQKQDAKAGGTLKFSKHATMRLMDRNINLSEEQNERLETGVFKAGEKGIRESLVIVDSLAFIVNVPNRIVVTAMDRTDSGGDPINIHCKCGLEFCTGTYDWGEFVEAWNRRANDETD